ncbi:hypothetical protein PHPALM_20906 [Phytophthora palmivora]|uniref:Uncharacterized protein n=1 Tax=Phytophthora palmivora TaxID=4796 RepID=A0A2P4XDN4_9STRA|nr:hypothetical protein PHPALM_20906 [Phytophthora palmivora]
MVVVGSASAMGMNMKAISMVEHDTDVVPLDLKAMAAALLHDFHKCCGIEVLDGLHAVALKVLDRWRYQMLDSLPVTKVDVEVGFANDDALIQAISTEADQLAVGSYFVAVTKPLQSTQWQAMHEEKFHMNWGRATVIVQKKMF